MNRGVSILRSIAGHPRSIARRVFSTNVLCGSFYSQPLWQTTCSANIRYNYQTYTSRTFAKASKKSKKNADKTEEGDGSVAELPDPKTAEELMANALKKLTAELSKIRNGSVSADMFNEVPIESYGFVGSAGQVTVKSPTKIAISVYDPSVTQQVANAIRNHTKMGLNPSTEGNIVSITVPKPSKEFRDDMLKQASLTVEKVKSEVRAIRKDTLDAVKKNSKGTGVSEDAVRKLSKEIDSITEKKIEGAVKLLKAKEKDIASS